MLSHSGRGTIFPRGYISNERTPSVDAGDTESAEHVFDRQHGGAHVA